VLLMSPGTMIAACAASAVSRRACSGKCTQAQKWLQLL
jgi:hypothetical protein